MLMSECSHSYRAGPPPLCVCEADAAEADAWGRAAFDLALLDAYDGRGDVPAHLQREPFLEGLSRVLRPGGFALANLWNGSDRARAECARFAAKLRAAVGRVYVLRVAGHEQNVILLACRPGERQGSESTCDVLRERLAAAAAAAATDCPEPALVQTIRSCASSLTEWSECEA